ncbi:hypothetical protein SNEBB_000336 [Seison nebaliae]|nr:hypothetical protein SNEBB_000336 [Seison nebaliae]
MVNTDASYVLNPEDIRHFHQQFTSTHQWTMKHNDIKQISQRRTCEFSNNESLANLNRNRYANVLSFDHTRVHLPQTKNDYINANFVYFPSVDQIYISAQGPLDGTIHHFWHMIWNLNINCIVMLNNLEEKKRIKCAMYYPSFDNLDKRDSNMDVKSVYEANKNMFHIICISEITENENYTIRELSVFNYEMCEHRTIFHCHYVKWPDFGAPVVDSNFLQFIEVVHRYDSFGRKKNKLSSVPPNSSNEKHLCHFSHPPLLVHCSAGIGRTGTFIVIDLCMKLLDRFVSTSKQDETMTNFVELVVHLRTCREGLIQSPSQLEFCVEFLLYFIDNYLTGKRNEQIIDFNYKLPTTCLKNDENVEEPNCKISHRPQSARHSQKLQRNPLTTMSILTEFEKLDDHRRMSIGDDDNDDDDDFDGHDRPTTAIYQNDPKNEMEFPKSLELEGIIKNYKKAHNFEDKLEWNMNANYSERSSSDNNYSKRTSVEKYQQTTEMVDDRKEFENSIKKLREEYKREKYQMILFSMGIGILFGIGSFYLSIYIREHLFF